VVEDEALIAFMVEHALAQAGHEVLGPVPSVAEALKLAQEQPVDLALLDVDLGLGGNGVDLARCLCEHQGLACLFASGSPREAQRARDVALGLLSKPYSAEEVVLAVEAAAALIAGEKPVKLPASMVIF
jgi:DNA-binding response OmpR family regulator